MKRISRSGRLPAHWILSTAIFATLAAGCNRAQERVVDQDYPGPSRTAAVQKTDYHGWKDAWRISNGACELIIVPQVNRVMYFGLIGSPSALWNNDSLAGQVQLSDDHQWHNFGGDKVWPTQQDWWKRFSDRQGWPPPYTFDAAPAVAEAIPNGVRITTQKSPDYGTRTVREFVMDASRPMVIVRQ
jgi:hypothetical protein